MAIKGNEERPSKSRNEALILVVVPPEKVYFLKFLLEASGHLAFPTVKEGGLIELRCDEAALPTLYALLENLPFVISWKKKDA